MSEKTFESRGANLTSSFRYPCTKATACRDAHDLHGKVFFLHIPKCSGTSFTYEARQLLPNMEFTHIIEVGVLSHVRVDTRKSGMFSVLFVLSEFLMKRNY